MANAMRQERETTSGAVDPSIRLQLALVDGIAAALCLVASIVVLTGTQGGLAAILVLTAVVLGSGWVLSGSLPYRSPSFSVTLTLSVGIAVPIVVGMVCVGLGWWHPFGTVAAILVLSAAGNSIRCVARLRTVTQ